MWSQVLPVVGQMASGVEGTLLADQSGKITQQAYRVKN